MPIAFAWSAGFGNIVTIIPRITAEVIAPLEAVAGNNDPRGLIARFGRRKVLDVAGTRIGVIHGDGRAGTTVSLSNVTIVTGAETQAVLGNDSEVTGLRYKERVGGASHDVALAGVFVQIGLIPNTDWLKGTVALSARGEVEVDARGQTSVPGVFAAGDCTTVPYKQIVIALGEGSKAALSAFDHLIRTPVAAAA